jgi:hypothetical protein
MAIQLNYFTPVADTASIKASLLTRTDVTRHITDAGVLLIVGNPTFTSVLVIGERYVASSHNAKPDDIKHAFVLLPAEQYAVKVFDAATGNDPLIIGNTAPSAPLLNDAISAAIEKAVSSLILQTASLYKSKAEGHKAAGEKYFRMIQNCCSNLLSTLDYLPHHDFKSFTGYRNNKQNLICTDSRVLSHGSKATLERKHVVSHMPQFPETAADITLTQFLFEVSAIAAPLYLTQEHWLSPMVIDTTKVELKADITGASLLGTFSCEQDGLDYEIVAADSITVKDDYTGLSIGAHHFYLDGSFEDAGYTSNLPQAMTKDKNVIVITRDTMYQHPLEVVQMFLDITDSDGDDDEEAIYHVAEQLSQFIKVKSGSSIESLFSGILNNLPQSTRMLLGEQLLTVAVKDGQFSVESAYS